MCFMWKVSVDLSKSEATRSKNSCELERNFKRSASKNVLAFFIFPLLISWMRKKNSEEKSECERKNGSVLALFFISKAERKIKEKHFGFEIILQKWRACYAKKRTKNVMEWNIFLKKILRESKKNERRRFYILNFVRAKSETKSKKANLLFLNLGEEKLILRAQDP